MMLGVVLHSAQLFSPEKVWLLYSAESSATAGATVAVLHLFRMPAFFVVSGYFCMLTLKRYGSAQFLKIRLKRIVVPMIATGLSLNIIQAIILAETGWKEVSFSSFFLGGGWVSHLWFLNYLVVYFIIATLIVATANHLFTKALSSFRPSNPTRLLIIILFSLPVYTIGIRALGLLGVPLYWDLAGIIYGYDLLFYLQFFAFGFWLQTNPRIMTALTQLKLLLLIAVIACAAAIHAFWTNESSWVMKIIQEYFHMLVVWFSIALCFGLFYRLTNEPSRLFRFLSDASYSVYLVHHLLVVLLGLVLIQLELNPLLAFGITIVMVLAASLIIHQHIIARSTLLRYLFNGK